jgi:NADH-quinone oxidoreductase subunit L
VLQGTRVAHKVQSGYLYSYALVMLLGLVAAISWVMVG